MQINYNTDDPKYKAEAQKSYNLFLNQVGESMAEAQKIQKDMGEALPICYNVEGGPVTYGDLHTAKLLSYGARLGGTDTSKLYINDQWAIVELGGGGPASRLVIKQEIDYKDHDLELVFYYQYQEWFKDWLNVYVSSQDNDVIKEWLFNYVDITLEESLNDYFVLNNQVNILNY